MLELRQLFALMTASTRKYLDPTRAVELLKGNIGNNKGSTGGITTNADNVQQDVSEFTHIFLDWLEEAFKPAAPESSKEERMDQGEESETTPAETTEDKGEDSENVDPNKGNRPTGEVDSF